jgi:predicted MFS family arabinose efflux permease
MRKFQAPRDLLVVAISLCLWGVGEGMFAYFQPIYLKELGADPLAIGGILSIIGISMTVAQIPSGYLSDRFGPRPVMWMAWVTGTVSTAVMALARGIPLFVLGMALYGLTAFVVAPMNSYLTQVRENWNVERAITIPSAFYNSGMVVGAILGGAVATAFGIRSIYMISLVIFVLSTFVIFFARPEPVAVHAATSQDHPRIFQNPRFLGLLGLILITTFALYLPQPLTPNFLQNQAGLSYQTIGYLGAVGSLGNAVISFALHGMEAPLAFLAGQVLVAIYALLMWQGKSAVWYGVGYFFIGGYRLARSMSLAYARQFIRATEVGLAYGVVETANSIAIILAPLVAGWLYNTDPRSMYTVSAGAIGLVILVNLVIRLRTRRAQLRGSTAVSPSDPLSGDPTYPDPHA